MTIKDEYFRYLDHFRSTATLREIHEHPEVRDIVSLRHDIDHDLDLALETAHHEHARGIHATYFLLHTHPYWNDPQFHSKCAQLQAYGHEVGLHLNVLVQWMRGECDEIDICLAEALDHLRQRGVHVTGTSAHGDRACYEHQLINYWAFSELRSNDPAANERHRSAEGVVVDDPRWQVRYPIDNMLKRADGRSFQLWSSSLAKHGLVYDAMHLKFDRYWTDSGGSWSRSGDPLSADLSRGRHQILMHPYWWRGARKTYFVLSTARAGSMWLANFVDRVTSARGLHEWTLNHHREGDAVIDDKRTNDDYLSLVEQPQDASILIRHALSAFKLERRDVLEANVYLEPFVERIRKIAPECVLIHLHRDGREVVRSILNRGWYATPIDRRHRSALIPEWDSLTQFARACWYVRFTNERLMALEHRLEFEKMVSDPEYLRDFLQRLGIVVHPLLAAEDFSKRLNAGTSDRFPPSAEWPASMRRTFDRICGSMQAALGYEAQHDQPTRNAKAAKHGKPFGARTVKNIDLLTGTLRNRTAHGVTISDSAEGWRLAVSPETDSNVYVLLARGNWRQVSRKHAIAAKPAVYYAGEIIARPEPGTIARVFALFFGRDDQQIHKTQLTTLRPPLSSPKVDPSATSVYGEASDHIDTTLIAKQFAFEAPLEATHFALAVHFEHARSGYLQAMTIQSLMLSTMKLEKNYKAIARGVAVASRGDSP